VLLDHSERRLIPNLISSGLFGDGVAAVIVAGEECNAFAPESEQLGPKILATRSVFYPQTEEMMGWRISEKGFSIALSCQVRNLVRRQLGQWMRSPPNTDTLATKSEAGCCIPTGRRYLKP
jgi:predicted naringenin-chalcone synthase